MTTRKPVTMTIDEAVRERRSVRGFLAREVPEALLHEVFDLAQRTPSNCNVQPWVPHVVSGDALKRLRDELVQAGLDQRLLFGISFGYEDTSIPANAARVGRAGLGEAVRFHR